MKDVNQPIAKKERRRVFESSSYLKVIDSIKANIHNNSGLTVLTGETGTGKSLIIRKVINDLEGLTATVLLDDPRYTINEILISSCEQIGGTPALLEKERDAGKQLKIFYEYLEERSQKKDPVTLFFDDAQNISTETLFSILSLLRGQPDRHRPLQIILIGLPELETLLASTKLSELHVVSPVYLSLNPLGTDEVGAFVAQCLHESGIDEKDFISREAISRIALYTRGIPRLVRILFDSTMAILDTNQDGGISVDIVDAAVNHFSFPWAVENNNDGFTSALSQDKTGKKTLISEIREKVTDLFSQTKIDDNEYPVDWNYENSFQDGMGSFDETAKEMPLHDGDLDNGEFDIPERNSEEWMETTGNEAMPSIQQPKLKQIQQNDQVETMNMQEETMNRGERLNKVLKALQSGSPDVEAVALISEDGLIVASALPQDLDEIRVGGMSATLLSLGTRSSAELRRGKVEEIIVRGEQGYTVMLNAGRGTLLLVVANENAKLGLIFFDMHEAIEKITVIL